MLTRLISDQEKICGSMETFSGCGMNLGQIMIVIRLSLTYGLCCEHQLAVSKHCHWHMLYSQFVVLEISLTSFICQNLIQFKEMKNTITQFMLSLRLLSFFAGSNLMFLPIVLEVTQCLHIAINLI